MKKNLINKGLVFGIIVLFIGTSVVPNISRNVRADDVPIYEFLTYANFGSDNSCYVPGQGAGGYGNNVYVVVGSYCYVYEISIPDGEDPDMHPDNPENPGPMAPRSINLVQKYNFKADCGWSGYHHAEFYVDEEYIYYGPDYYGTGGIEQWSKNPDDTFGSYLGRVRNKNGDPIPVPPTNGETFCYDAATNTWYTCTRGRSVYSFDMDEDTSWQYEFTYPTYQGSHHDGLEFVNGFLWISDMTTNWIGQWKKNPDGTWEEVARFYYDNPIEDDVEGMGFGPLGHLWVTGWSRLYEIGGKELGTAIEGIQLSITLDKEEYWPTDIIRITAEVTDPDGNSIYPLTMDKIEVKIDENYVNILDDRIENAIEWADPNTLKNYEEMDRWCGTEKRRKELNNPKGFQSYSGYCLTFTQDAYDGNWNSLQEDSVIPRYSYAKEAADELGADFYGIPPRGAYVFYDCWGTIDGEYRNWGHVGLSIGDGNVVHAFGKVRIDNYLDIENLFPGDGWTYPEYIGWVWPPIDVNMVNEKYLLKVKAPSEGSEHTVWMQVETDMGSAENSATFTVFEPFTFIHMTDIHMGWNKEIIVKKGWLWGKETRKIPSAKILSGAVKKIIDLEPDFVLVTGDIGEWAEKSFYNEYLLTLTPLSKNSINVYNVIGNHDRYTDQWYVPTPWDPAAQVYDETINKNLPVGLDYLFPPFKFDYYFSYQRFIFVGLDSGYIPPGGIKGGGLVDEQMTELNKLPSNRPKIIFLHHPVFDIEGRPLDDHRIQDNRPQFINYCKDKNVALVLSGHTHDNQIFDEDGDPWQNKDKWEKSSWPLFIQTPSLTKDGSASAAFREISVNGNSIKPKYWVPRNYVSLQWVLESPATLHAFDPQDRHTGINFTTGEIEQNIPQSFYFGGYSFETINETNETVNEIAPATIITYDINQDYTLKIIANLTEEQKMSPEIEHFNFTVERQTNDSLLLIFYVNVSLYENTTAILPFNMTTTNYTMNIDYDGDGITDETKTPDFIKVDYMPEVEIISPLNNSTYLFGEEIVFKGNGSDLEDGNLTNISFVWTSDINGQIGIGKEFNTTYLSTGRHNITLSVNDTLGQISTSTISIVIRDTRSDMFIDILKEDETLGTEHHTNVVEASADDPCNLTVYIKNTGYGTLHNVTVFTNVNVSKTVGDIAEGEATQIPIEFIPTTLGFGSLNITVISDQLERNLTRTILVVKFTLIVSLTDTAYNLSDPVQINISITNEVPNMRFIDLNTRINITGSSYSQNFDIPILSLGPLVTKNISFTWDTTGTDSGTYSIVTSLMMANQKVTSDTKTISLGTILITDLTNIELLSADPGVTSITITRLNLSEINETYKPPWMTPQYAYMINSTGTGNFTLRFTDIQYANHITVYKINETNHWIKLNYTTTFDNVTIMMSVEDPPVVFTLLVVSATIDIDPDTLNLNSTGKWITCYLELPEGYDVEDINVSTILLNDTVSAETHPTNISDYDNDSIPDLMVKFDRQDVQAILNPGENVAITVSGKLFDETMFEGTDYIKAI